MKPNLIAVVDVIIYIVSSRAKLLIMYARLNLNFLRASNIHVGASERDDLGQWRQLNGEVAPHEHEDALIISSCWWIWISSPPNQQEREREREFNCEGRH